VKNIPTIAIVGRINVGKSTLFNRLAGFRKAIVSSMPGTTRDRAICDCIWRGLVVRCVDTGGVDIKNPDEIEREIIRQAEIAMAESDAIIVLVDAQTHVTDFDRKLADKVSKLGKPFLIAANKADTSKAKSCVNDPWTWSYGEPFLISAAQGHGVGDMLDELFKMLEKIGKPPADIVDVQATRVTVIGKPNVGKSSLLNKLLQQNRFIVSSIEHTTREPNDTHFNRNEREYIFIDTAGMRRKAMKRDVAGLEKLAVEKNLESLKKTDIVLFIIDATEPIGAQDKILAGIVSESDAGIIIVVNKWDLVQNKTPKTTNEYDKNLRILLPTLKHAAIAFVSALNGQRVDSLFDIIDSVQKNRFAQFSGEELEKFIRRAIVRHKPPKGMGTAPPKILGFNQIDTAPPRFEIVIKSRFKKKLQESYVRYLENCLHDEFGLIGAPARVYIRPVQGGE
jgi:GTP-binding protein